MHLASNVFGRKTFADAPKFAAIECNDWGIAIYFVPKRLSTNFEQQNEGEREEDDEEEENGESNHSR